MGRCWPQTLVLEGHVGLKNRSWKASCGVLGPSCPKTQTRPPRVRRRASKGLPGAPKLESELDPKRTMLGPKYAEVGDFVDMCLLLCVHVSPKTHRNPIRGPLDSKMFPKSAQHARAESHEMRAVLLRNTLYRFWCPHVFGIPLAPHLGPTFCPSWSQVGAQSAQVGPKRDPRPLENDHKTTQKNNSKTGDQNPCW